MKNFYFPAVLIFFLTAFQQSSFADNIYKKLSVAQCDSLIQANQNNPDFVILDVRIPASWKPAHLYGSICRNFYDSDFEQQLDALPKHKMYLVHCQSGGRSGQAFIKMQNLQFAEVYDMKGGMNAWNSGNYSTTSVIEPKLMLVAYDEFTGEYETDADTVKITVTNRANDTLAFSSAAFTDIHNVATNFDEEIRLAGAEDYSFYLYHSAGFAENESTQIDLESNGGSLEFEIIYKNGVIQSVPENRNNQDIELFPNPASQFVILKSATNQQPGEVTITSITGRQILLQPKVSGNNINVSGLPNGIYIINIKNKGLQTSKNWSFNISKSTYVH